MASKGKSTGGVKAQPMYTKKDSMPAKLPKQIGTGLAKSDKKGYTDTADVKKVKATKQRLNQG